MQSPNSAFAGVAIIFWLIWLVVSVAALVAFFRGMGALVRMAETLDRIEGTLSAGRGFDKGGM